MDAIAAVPSRGKGQQWTFFQSFDTGNIFVINISFIIPADHYPTFADDEMISFAVENNWKKGRVTHLQSLRCRYYNCLERQD